MPTLVFNKYTTYDSAFLSNDVRAIASFVEPNLTTTWDLFQETQPGRSVKVEWYDYEKNPLSGEVEAPGWADGVSTTNLPVTDLFADIVNIGDILVIEDEQVIVSSVDRAANTINVYARGHGGSLAAAHADGVAIEIIGSAHVEGNVDGEGVIIDNLKRENYYQIVQELVDVTHTARFQQYDDLSQDSIEAKLQEYREKAMIKALKKMNKTVLFGLPYEGTKTMPRTCGGIKHFLSQVDVVNTDAGGAFDEDVLKQTLLQVGDRGGTPNILLCGTAVKSVINGFNAITNAGVQTRVDRSENVAGTIVDFYEGEGVGRLAVISDPLMASNELYVLNNRKMFKNWFFNDELRYVPEPSLSNSRRTVENLEGQFTVQIKDRASDFARIYNI